MADCEPVLSYYSETPAAPNYFNSQRPLSPVNSTSNSEVFNQSHRSVTPGGGSGGLVIYYSPDAGCISEAARFRSESELHTAIEGRQAREAAHRQRQTIASTHSGSHPMKRPMSFMKALEMTDKLEHNHHLSPRQQRRQTGNTEDNRQSQYEMNYEISV